MVYGYGKGRERADRATQPRREPSHDATRAAPSRPIGYSLTPQEINLIGKTAAADTLASLRPVEVGVRGR